MKVAVLIPSYNSGPLLRKTVEEVLDHWKEVLVVVDGSDDGSDDDLESVATDESPNLTVHRLKKNQGKGAAVCCGIDLLAKKGFTHALTLDADGQHPAEQIPKFVELGREHPEALVLGKPVFDDDAPALRVQGRKISNFWAHLETLWWGVGDSLFGMRLYPIEPLQRVFAQTKGARRFDFDPEVAVRLSWRGIPALNHPTPVRYLSSAEGGISQFRYARDNALLTWMHIRLFFGFLIRLPRLATRTPNPLKSK